MKSVLMSIKPEWCEKIANGWKTMELRKTNPKIELPFKVYIYCTNNKDMLWVTRENERNCEKIASRCIAKSVGGATKANGKVIGEFVCDSILCHCGMANADIAEAQSLVRREEIFRYGNGKKVYGWHISDLVIYDRPKDLSKFYRKCEDYPVCDDCEFCSWTIEEGYECVCDYEKPLKRPPQSWCYVEEHNVEE